MVLYYKKMLIVLKVRYNNDYIREDSVCQITPDSLDTNC